MKKVKVHPDMIEAMKELLEYYETGKPEKVKKSCPLCVNGFGVVINNAMLTGYVVDYCLICPWSLFTKRQCNRDNINFIDIGTLRANRNEEWLKHRIPQLKEWIANSIPCEEIQ